MSIEHYSILIHMAHIDAIGYGDCGLIVKFHWLSVVSGHIV